MKVLVDLDFCLTSMKISGKMRKALTVFDRIYAPADCQQLGDYGKENRLRIMRLPVLAAARPEENQVETVSTMVRHTLCVGNGTCRESVFP